MTSNQQIFYWDSSVFLAYINNEPGRASTIRDLWIEVSNKNDKIITSSFSITEVAWGAQEKAGGRLDPSIEEQIDRLWADPVIQTVDYSMPIAYSARGLMRDALSQGWVLKPIDAVHIATAGWVDKQVRPVNEIHTYDSWAKFQTMIGIHITHPHVEQPRLDLPDSDAL